MKIKVLIVEDEMLVAEDLSSDLENDGFEVTDVAMSGEEALNSLEKSSAHIVLMDINIKGEIDGIETAEQINRRYGLPIIYISSNTGPQFVSRVLKTSPYAFISKPFNHTDVVMAIELALKKHNERVIQDISHPKSESIFVKKGGYHNRIEIDEILYIEADGSYCKIYTEKGDFTLSINLNHFRNQVNNFQLRRVHRSYIVNLSKVDRLDKNTLLLGNHSIPVSGTYKEIVFDYFNKL